MKRGDNSSTECFAVHFRTNMTLFMCLDLEITDSFNYGEKKNIEEIFRTTRFPVSERFATLAWSECGQEEDEEDFV